MKSDLVDVEIVMHHETEEAWLISTDGVRKNAVWIPKQACEITKAKVGTIHTVTLTEDLAIEKGLV